MVDELDKKIIGLIQGDLPVDPRPFAVMAEEIGMSEDDFVARVRNLKEKGIMRRFGATLRHQEAGFSANAMVAWVVPESKVEEVGKTMAEFPEVTHCYQRRPQRDWKYNLYTMIHGENKYACFRLAQQMAHRTGMEDYLLLFSEKEFKKTSMQYF